MSDIDRWEASVRDRARRGLPNKVDAAQTLAILNEMQERKVIDCVDRAIEALRDNTTGFHSFYAPSGHRSQVIRLLRQRVKGSGWLICGELSSNVVDCFALTPGKRMARRAAVVAVWTIAYPLLALVCAAIAAESRLPPAEYALQVAALGGATSLHFFVLSVLR